MVAPGTRCWSVVSTRAARGIYALDITNPGLFAQRRQRQQHLHVAVQRRQDGDANANNNDLDLGYTYSRPAIVRMPNNGATPGKWVAIFGNG